MNQAEQSVNAAAEPLAEKDLTADTQKPEAVQTARLHHFLLPLATLIGVTLWYDLDVQIGVIVAVAVTLLLFGGQRIMAWGDMFDAVLAGLKMMLPALTIVVMAFAFKDVNDQLGLPRFVIDHVSPWMTPLIFPVVTFLTMALISFATGSSWGVFAIAIPIILPLAESVGVSIPLAIGALLSASAFGSHACFYSDATVLAAEGSGCDVIDHALTQFPYALLAALISCLVLTLLAAV
jgi:Na+/H+ antiporter NhaC